MMKELGDKIFIVGDDLVTTKDSNIEKCAKNGEINASLIKANQTTVTETVLAMLTSLGYGVELIVSHRSKSPNDPFEAEIATAMNAVGLKVAAAPTPSVCRSTAASWKFWPWPGPRSVR